MLVALNFVRPCRDVEKVVGQEISSGAHISVEGALSGPTDLAAAPSSRKVVVPSPACLGDAANCHVSSEPLFNLSSGHDGDRTLTYKPKKSKLLKPTAANKVGGHHNSSIVHVKSVEVHGGLGDGNVGLARGMTMVELLKGK